MFQFLENTDKELFLYLNGIHCSFCDAVMPVLTEFWIWIPLFAWWVFKLYRKYENKVITVLIFVAVLLFVSDQGANIIKKSVKRYRPSHNIELQEKVHIVKDYRGGQYGFISNHASNVFAVAFFLFFMLRPAKKMLLASLFIWALFVCYTRIYLGVHYPLDIAGGALWGFICALIVSKICFKILK